VGTKRNQYQTQDFWVDPSLVEIFCKHFDGNQVHLPGNSNEIMPQDTVPGLMIVSMAARAVLEVPEFNEILCATGTTIKNIRPVLRGQHCFVKGSYEDSPHKSRAGVIRRTNNCQIICRETLEMVIEYEMIQLLRDVGR
jgi:hypothetical protein